MGTRLQAVFHPASYDWPRLVRGFFVHASTNGVQLMT
jgi:hypothetical protein